MNELTDLIPGGVCLEPRGTRMTDLHGMSRAADFDGGGTWTSWTPEEHRKRLGESIAEADEIVAGLRTKKTAEEVYRRLFALRCERTGRAHRAPFGVPPGTIREARGSIHIFLIDLWFPRTFINEAPSSEERR